MNDRERQLLFLVRASLLPLVATLDGWKEQPQLVNVRASLIQLLGAVEDAAGTGRTFPNRDERLRRRLHDRPS